MANPIMADTRSEALIAAPIADIDVTEWVFGLTDAEYQACSKDHIAAATTRTADGRRMSINVEHVGRLLVQHYVEDVSERDRCRLVSMSDAFGPAIADRVKSDVTWEFWVEAVDADTTRFTNRVVSRAVDGWQERLVDAGRTLEEAQAQAQSVIGAHNAEETPLFAKDIERKAAEGRWA